jgi:hypothetical protein
MQIIAQSQTPPQPGYIHLAYISAAVNNRISKGDLFPVQVYLGAALAAAVACGMVAGKFSKMERRTSVKFAAMYGFIGTLCLLWVIESAWRARRTNEQVFSHVTNTRQWWALRDPAIATSVESAARTNNAAAHLAACYYHWAHADENEPEQMVKRYWFAERATNGSHGWPTLDATSDPRILTNFEFALKRGNLTLEEQAWAKEKLVKLRRSMDEQWILPDNRTKLGK